MGTVLYLYMGRLWEAWQPAHALVSPLLSPSAL